MGLCPKKTKKWLLKRGVLLQKRYFSKFRANIVITYKRYRIQWFMNLRKVRNLVLGLLFGILVVEIILMSPEPMVRGFADNLLEEFAGTENDPDQALKGIYLVETKKGRKDWEMWAKAARGFKVHSNWLFDDVKVVFYSNTGKSVIVRGKTGRVVMSQKSSRKSMRIDGDVKTKTSDGYQYWANSVVFSPQRQELISQGEVRLRGPAKRSNERLNVTGLNMRTELDSGTMHLEKDVKAQQTLANGQRAVVGSRRAEFSGKQKFAKFLGQTKVDIDGIRLTGPEAEFSYGEKAKAVETMTVRGGARVTDLDKWATSREVKVHFKDGRYVFKGDPRVVQDSDELRGDEIVFLDGGKKVRVKKFKANVSKEKVGK